MKKKKKNGRSILLLLLCLLLCLCSGCAFPAKDSTVVFGAGFGKDELFKIGSSVCTKQEYMVYLTNTQNRYEEVYGPEIWKVTMEEGSLEENIKQSVLARLAQIKTMYLLARQKNVMLTDQQKADINSSARSYYASLSSYEIEQLEISVDSLVQMYTEYALAKLVYQQIIDTVNPEVSDDEARIITVEHLYIKTYSISGEGQRQEYSDTLKENCKDKIETLRKSILDGELTFRDAAAKNEKLEVMEESFGRGEVEEALEMVAFQLQKNEISEVVQTADGYHLLKCISTYNREQTEENKKKLVEIRRNEAFGKEYEGLVNNLQKSLNEELLGEIHMLRNDKITTSKFFEYCLQ